MLTSSDRKAKIWSVIRVSGRNFLEMYEFMVFGYYASASGKAFFPSSSEFASLMLSLMTFRSWFSNAAARGHRARGVHRSSWTPRWARADVEPDVCGDPFHSLHAGVRHDRVVGPTAGGSGPIASGIFGRYGIRRRLGVLIRNRDSRSQRVLCQLAIGKPAVGGHVRSSAGGRT